MNNKLIQLMEQTRDVQVHHKFTSGYGILPSICSSCNTGTLDFKDSDTLICRDCKIEIDIDSINEVNHGKAVHHSPEH